MAIAAPRSINMLLDIVGLTKTPSTIGETAAAMMTLGKQKMRLLLSCCHRVGVGVYLGTDAREELRREEISLATPPSGVPFTIKSGSYVFFIALQ